MYTRSLAAWQSRSALSLPYLFLEIDVAANKQGKGALVVVGGGGGGSAGWRGRGSVVIVGTQCAVLLQTRPGPFPNPKIPYLIQPNL